MSILFLKDIIIQNKYQEVKNIKLIKSIVTPILHIFLVRRQSANWRLCHRMWSMLVIAVCCHIQVSFCSSGHKLLHQIGSHSTCFCYSRMFHVISRHHKIVSNNNFKTVQRQRSDWAILKGILNHKLFNAEVLIEE